MKSSREKTPDVCEIAGSTAVEVIVILPAQAYPYYDLTFDSCYQLTS